MPVSEQGVTLSRYMLIPRTLIFLTRRDAAGCQRVLLLKGAPHKRLWANRYNGIGGHIEAGEDVLSAARRELFEETGLTPQELWLCGVVTVDTGQNPGIGIFVLRGECPDGEIVVSEEGEPAWLPLAELDRLPLVEDLPILLPRLLAMQAGDAPFAARYHYDENGKLMIDFGG